jgi:hypothetical protein
MEVMVRRRILKPTGRDFVLMAPGARFLARLGVDVQKSRRERRTHLAGSLAAG